MISDLFYTSVVDILVTKVTFLSLCNKCRTTKEIILCRQFHTWSTTTQHLVEMFASCTPGIKLSTKHEFVCKQFSLSSFFFATVHGSMNQHACAIFEGRNILVLFRTFSCDIKEQVFYVQTFDSNQQLSSTTDSVRTTIIFRSNYLYAC